MRNRERGKIVGLCLAVVSVTLVLAATLACATPQPTSTPVPPAKPAQPVAPTPLATTIPVLAPPTPTSVTAAPTPTRVLPTATPVATGKPQYGGTLRTAKFTSFDNFDPAFTTLAGFRPIQYTIFNNLVQLTPQGVVGPELARSWQISPDGKAVTFTLQQGVKFHDGTPLDAKAVKWNYDRLLDPVVGSARGRELSPPLQRVEVVDDSTVTFHLSSAFRPLMATLTQQAGWIVSPTAVQKYNSYSNRQGDYGKNPAGTGPFKFKEWLPDRYIAVVRNENYWEKGLPYLESVRLDIIPDNTVKFAMLRVGELDIVETLNSRDAAIASANPELMVVPIKGSRYRFILFRVSKEPFNNKASRRAIAYALDRETLAKVLYAGGTATPAYSMIGPVYGQWFDPSIKVYEYNPQKAREELARAGYPSGFSFEFVCSTEAFTIQLCETVQAMLVKVGISMKIRLYATAPYFSDFNAGRQDGPISSQVTPRPDPHFNIQRYFHSRGANNTMGYLNPDVDRLIDEAGATFEMAKAKELYRQAITLIAEDAVKIFLTYEDSLYGLRRNVQGFAPVLDDIERMRDLWLAK